MILLKWRFFSMALLLVIAATMPNVIKAQTQMNEIPLGSGGSGGGAQTMSIGNTTLDGGTGGSFPGLAARADNLDDVVDAFCHGSSSQSESSSHLHCT